MANVEPFTMGEIESIRSRLENGWTGIQVAEDAGIEYQKFMYRLEKTGYKIVVTETRRLARVTKIVEDVPAADGAKGGTESS